MNLSSALNEIIQPKSKNFVKQFKEFVVENYLDPLKEYYFRKLQTAKEDVRPQYEFIHHSLGTVVEGIAKCNDCIDVEEFLIKHVLAIKGIDDSIREAYIKLRTRDSAQIYVDFINGKKSFFNFLSLRLGLKNDK